MCLAVTRDAIAARGVGGALWGGGECPKCKGEHTDACAYARSKRRPVAARLSRCGVCMPATPYAPSSGRRSSTMMWSTECMVSEASRRDVGGESESAHQSVAVLRVHPGPARRCERIAVKHLAATRAGASSGRLGN